jgi:hypothetical protein
MPDFLSERISLSEWQSFLSDPELANTARGLKGDVAIIESVTVPHNLTIGINLLPCFVSERSVSRATSAVFIEVTDVSYARPPVLTTDFRDATINSAECKTAARVYAALIL